MKIQPSSLVLSICLGMATAAMLTLSPGCVAGDRYNRSTGEYVDDKSIGSRVRDALNNNSEFKFDGVQVATFKGTVQLSGYVDTYAQKYTAASITKKVQGVRQVENNLTVTDTSDRSAGEYLDDKALISRVNSAFNNNAGYKFEQVSVVAFKGSVQLGGFVNNADQKAKAEDIARQIPGAQGVVNGITVKDKMQTAK